MVFTGPKVVSMGPVYLHLRVLVDNCVGERPRCLNFQQMCLS